MQGPEDVEEVELQEAERINRVDDSDFFWRECSNRADTVSIGRILWHLVAWAARLRLGSRTTVFILAVSLFHDTDRFRSCPFRTTRSMFSSNAFILV